MRTNAATTLDSWNDGPAKQAIADFVAKTTDPANPNYVPPADRIATFDQDGTLWVEHPIYTEATYSLQRVLEIARSSSDASTREPFKTVLSGQSDAIAHVPWRQLMTAAMTGFDTDAYEKSVSDWIDDARDARFHQHYVDLVYEPMLEVMNDLRAHGYKTFIVTGASQDFVRAYSERAFGVPPEQVVGTAAATTFEIDKHGKPLLTEQSYLTLDDSGPRKPPGIHLIIGHRPHAAFGNSGGDQQVLEYTGGGNGARLVMLVLHDDASREYAYGPARGLPDSGVGTFPTALDDEATRQGWTVISMKHDWKHVFCFGAR